MVQKQKQAGPDYNAALRWTDRQVKAGKLDIDALQLELTRHGVLNPGWTPGRFDRATFDALCKFQRGYAEGVKELGKRATREMMLNVSREDGMAGTKTIAALAGLHEQALGMLERKQDLDGTRGETRVARVVPSRRVEEPERQTRRETERPPVTRGPERLTEEAAMARLQRVVGREDIWQNATIKRVIHADGPERYELRLPMPDGKVLELAISTDNRLYPLDSDLFGTRSSQTVRDEVRGLVLAAITNYGEVGKPGKDGYALVRDMWIVDGGHETQRYAQDGGDITRDFKSVQDDSKVSYTVHMARQLKPYDRS
ncbi:MAG: hypothetical protein ABH842_03505 [Candidatus Micrarchaeota archaeon]